MRWLRENVLSSLLIFVPIALFLEFGLHKTGIPIFATAALAIIPLAGLMGRATEQLAERLGAGIGGLLNATFGNAAELIIAIVAVRAGLYDLVKASITGSIIGNILLVFGAGALYGGLKYETQRFNAMAASLGATMLMLSAIGLLIPAIFHLVAGANPQAREGALSFEIAVVLMVTYVLSLIFTLKTHRHLYSGTAGDAEVDHPKSSMKKALFALLAATVGIAVMSEMLVGAVGEAAGDLGMNSVFVGVILVAIIGNAAEHSTAIIMAGKNKMDVAINIAVGSSIQIALFVAPMLVFLSYAMGPHPMDLIFSMLEVLSIALSVAIMAFISHDGETHWMEGVQLLAVYAMLGMAFYFLPV
ncbi:MAG TPA: calcium/proton exchanger [Longimicrobiales bacterium]|nr:calcium/proton exchanger [Longimicrobiales bacterium]